MMIPIFTSCAHGVLIKDSRKGGGWAVMMRQIVEVVESPRSRADSREVFRLMIESMQCATA
jgi:hypothetical protein